MESTAYSEPQNAYVQSVGIIMYGVTGRMGTNQHLLRRISAFIPSGGMPVPSAANPTSIILSHPVLVGRSEYKLRNLFGEVKSISCRGATHVNGTH
jgi:hypothetical protein